MKKPKILIHYAIPPKPLSKLENDFEIIYPENDFFTDDELLKHLPDCFGFISIFNKNIDVEILKTAKKLKIISNYGVGYNNIPIDTANKMNIKVCNTPNSVCLPTAELCIGLCINMMRRVSEFDQSIKLNSKLEFGANYNFGNTFKGKTLGILGMGKIGKIVAQIAKILGASVIYHNRKKITNIDFSAKFVDFKELLESSDILSIHCPLTEETKHMLTLAEFSIMKKSAILINTARGAIIKEADLAAALENNIIKAAALDVFENEPLIHTNLKKLKNVLMVPHIGTATKQTREDMSLEAVENIINFMNKKEFNCVNKDTEY
ncbi:MAG: D-glycerate dehydrogenase [Marinifilaceae bacterium]|nr:D-glycerate dehydrogenase [Marinifilaceae bacterium]